MCPCACRAPIGYCSVPAAAPTRRWYGRTISSCSTSTVTSFIIPAAPFRWNGASTPAFTATGPSACASPTCMRGTRRRWASPVTTSCRSSCTDPFSTAACRPGTTRGSSSTTSRRPTSRARSATRSRCRCAAMAASWSERALRQPSSAARSWRRMPASNWRPRSSAERSRCRPTRRGIAPRAPTIRASSTCCGRTTSAGWRCAGEPDDKARSSLPRAQLQDTPRSAAMTFRPIATSFVVGFFLAALANAASPAAAQTAPLNPRVAIKLGPIGAVSDAGIFIAQEKGYFTDEGLDVELVSFKAAPQILPAIATGEVQVSGSAVTPALFNAFARGIGMKLVADKGQVAKGFGFAAIVIRSDLTDTVKDFKDLKGRKFAVMGKGVSSTAQLGKALELGGIEPSEVEFVELGLPEMVAALGNKAIDGATLLEPFITLATVRNVAVRWKGMEDFLPFTGQNGVIIYSQRFAEEQGEAAKRWMVAYLKGTRAYLDAVTSGADRDGVNAILAKHTAVKDVSLLGRIAPTGFDPNGRLEIKSLEADQDWFLKLGLQQGRADLSRVIDYQYLDYAVSQLGKR